jgi:hypothetical protein
MCEKQVSGPNYCCERYSGLLLHKTCAELRRELQHPLHPKHSLLLINVPWNPEAQCEGCNRLHIRRGFNYYCFDCNFNLDRRCASLLLTVEVESHAHPLTLMRRSVSFTCDACGKQGKGMFYSCCLPILGPPRSLMLLMGNSRIMKNVMHVGGLSTLHFIVVLNAYSFFTNLLLNYPEKCHTHFIDISSFSSHSHLMLVSILAVMLVNTFVMASPTIVANACSTLLSNVV